MSTTWGQAMRVLVAGDRGYIGAVLVPFMRMAGHDVGGLDLDLYEGCDLRPAPEDIGGRFAVFGCTGCRPPVHAIDGWNAVCA
jgi:nucleoside-diphosphate-sugar epimerase